MLKVCSSESSKRDCFGKYHEEFQYLRLINDILDHGSMEEGRNGKAKTVFGSAMHFDLSENTIPVLTTKKVAFKTCLKELLWFINGHTDNKLLKEQNVKIWNANASREFLDSRGLHNNKEDDLGPVYGHQWRHFNAPYLGCNEDYSNKGVDQLNSIISSLNDPNNKYSRRLIMSAWNPCQLSDMVLPPCHVLYQFKVDTKKKTLSCILYQRSADIALGVPFNIASASLLTHVIAFLSNLKVGILTHFIGDGHIYEEHKEGLIHQLDRYLFPLPKLTLKQRNQKKPEDFCFQDFILDGYLSNTSISFPLIV